MVQDESEKPVQRSPPMKFLLMPLELALMVVYVVRNCMRVMDDDYGPEAASSVIPHDALPGLPALK
jgi:hypothetical protein